MHLIHNSSVLSVEEWKGKRESLVIADEKNETRGKAVDTRLCLYALNGVSMNIVETLNE